MELSKEEIKNIFSFYATIIKQDNNIANKLFYISGFIISIDGGTIYLKKPDGDIFTCPIKEIVKIQFNSGEFKKKFSERTQNKSWSGGY